LNPSVERKWVYEDEQEDPLKVGLLLKELEGDKWTKCGEGPCIEKGKSLL